MKSSFVPTVAVLAILALSAPVVAQEVPDYIPDDPEESLADREQKRRVERYRHILSRFFSTGGFGVAPVTGHGFGYQASFGLGYRLRSGDAVFAAFGARTFPSRDRFDVTRSTLGAAQAHLGIGYQVSGNRLFGDSPTAHRLAVDFGAGVLIGDNASAATLEVAPTYTVIQRDGWSVPLGVRLNLVALDGDDLAFTRAFAALELGVRWQWLRRERVE